jgi:hypothetical protein
MFVNLIKNSRRETVKAQKSAASSYLTREEHEEQKGETKNYFDYANLFGSSSTSFWQSIITNWLNAYGELFRSGIKLSEYWFDTCWKPWLTMQQYQQNEQNRHKVRVE